MFFILLELQIIFKFDMSGQLPKLKEQNPWLTAPAHAYLNKIFDLDRGIRDINQINESIRLGNICQLSKL